MMTLMLTSALRSAIIVGATWVGARALKAAAADLRRRAWAGAIAAVAALPALVWMASRVGSPPWHFAIGAATAGYWAAASSLPVTISWLTVGWAAGAALILGRWLAGVWTVARMTSGAATIAGRQYSDAIVTPLTWGVIRPVILLPSYTRDWAEERRELLVRHEQAHIDQHDWAWQLLAQIVCAVFWFQPLVWLAAVELSREAELAADDRVLRHGADARTYAEQLLAIGRHAQRTSPRVAVAMVRRPALERRVAAILDPKRRRVSISRTARLTVLTLTLIVPVAFSLPVAARQNGHVYTLYDEDITPPRPVIQVKPQYTEEALQQKIQGSVLLSTDVNADGEPQNIVILRSLDPVYGLDDNAVAALQGWRFEPGRKDGTPVIVEVHVEIMFSLK